MSLLFYIRKLQVTPQSKACCSPWNALQVIFVLFTLATMFSMMWFTFILKTSLETMKKRVTSCKYRLLCCIIIIFIGAQSNMFQRLSETAQLKPLLTFQKFLVLREWLTD